MHGYASSHGCYGTAVHRAPEPSHAIALLPGEARDVEAGRNVLELLRHLGEEPCREGLARTPQRVVGALRFLTSGYEQSVAEATHLCMVMRGVQKQNSHTVTSSMLGQFLNDPRTRAELMELVRVAPS